MQVPCFNILRLKAKPLGPVVTYVKSDFDEEDLKRLGSDIRSLTDSEEYSIFSMTRNGRNLTFMGTGSGSPSLLTALFEVYSSNISALVRIGACGGLNETRVGEIIVCNSTYCMDKVSSTLAGASETFPDSGLSADIVKSLLNDRVEARAASNVSVDAMYLFEANIDQAERDRVSCWDLETATVLAFGRKFRIRAASVLEVVSDRGNNSSLTYPPLRRLDHVKTILDMLTRT
jgi:uridine phosphorylase